MIKLPKPNNIAIYDIDRITNSRKFTHSEKIDKILDIKELLEERLQKVK
jgi:hypothetical protein